jgi:hypothetical protein
LTEVGEQPGDAPGDGLVAFGFAGPSLLGGLGGQLELGAVSFEQPGGVSGSGDELGAGQEQVALAGAFGG